MAAAIQQEEREVVLPMQLTMQPIAATATTLAAKVAASNPAAPKTAPAA